MNPEKKDRSARATVFKTKRAKTTRSPTTSRKNLSQKTKSEKNITKSKKIGSPSVMGGGGERFNKSAPDRSRKTSPDDRSDKSQKMKRAPNRTLLKTPPSLNLVSVQKAKTIMNRSKKPSDRSQQKPRQKAVSVLNWISQCGRPAIQTLFFEKFGNSDVKACTLTTMQSIESCSNIL
uniref:Uncharacterized protein n=1 Tax=Romanomermis culicivorax TaxID=13658 RepID=A0A915JY32_ROMCU